MLARPGIGVEDRSFTAVGIARQGNAQLSRAGVVRLFKLDYRTHALYRS